MEGSELGTSDGSLDGVCEGEALSLGMMLGLRDGSLVGLSLDIDGPTEG